MSVARTCVWAHRSPRTTLSRRIGSVRSQMFVAPSIIIATSEAALPPTKNRETGDTRQKTRDGRRETGDGRRENSLLNFQRSTNHQQAYRTAGAHWKDSFHRSTHFSQNDTVFTKRTKRTKRTKCTKCTKRDRPRVVGHAESLCFGRDCVKNVAELRYSFSVRRAFGAGVRSGFLNNEEVFCSTFDRGAGHVHHLGN